MLAVAVEPGYGRPILPSFHGGWTVGGILASALILAPASLPWSSTAVATLPYLLASGVQRLAGGHAGGPLRPGSPAVSRRTRRCGVRGWMR